MSNVRRFVLAALAGSVLAAAQPALAQTTLTMSSWVSPTHHITAVVLQGWATELTSEVSPAPGSSAIIGRMCRAGV